MKSLKNGEGNQEHFKPDFRPSETFFSFLAEKQLYQTQPEVIKLLNSRAAVFLLMKILRTFADGHAANNHAQGSKIISIFQVGIFAGYYLCSSISNK